MSLSDNKCISLLIAVCALVMVLMLPLINSVYSDDVAFSESVRHLTLTGDLKVSEYTAASSISHILWGFLFVKILGFSFSSLNLSVIILLPILLVGFFKLLRTLDIPPIKSLFFTLFFFSIPWIPFLTYTFMSDIPFLTLEIWSLILTLKYIKHDNAIYLTLSLIFASIAFLMRQLGLALILGTLAVILFNYKRHNLKKHFLVFLIPFLVIAVYWIWLSIPGNKTIPQYYYEDQTKKSIGVFLPFTKITLEDRISALGLYLHRTIKYANQTMGLIFPLLLTIAISNYRHLKVLLKTRISLITTSSLAIGVIYCLDLTFFRKNYTAGFPLLIYEYESFLPIAWAHIWKFMVIFSIPVWAALSFDSLKRMPKLKSDIFLLSTFLIFTLMTIITFQDWDRYVLPFLPFVFIFLAQKTNRLKLNKYVATVIVIIMVIDSVQITKLRYDEAGLLYKIGNNLVANGVEPSEIDLNRDQGWDIWFYYEDTVSRQIKDAKGDKRQINFQLYPLPKKEVKYAIFTDRMIKYQSLKIDYSKAKLIPFKSLFVTSKLTLLEN